MTFVMLIIVLLVDINSSNNNIKNKIGNACKLRYSIEAK